MNGRARIGLGVCGVLLIGGAWIARQKLPGLLAPETFAAAVPASGDDPLPVLGYLERQPAANESPKIDEPAFFEEQASRAEVLERLAKYSSAAAAAPEAPTAEEPTAEEPTAEARATEPAAELIAQFERRAEAKVAETAKASLPVEGIASAEALAVSASGTVVAVATGEECRLFDIEPSEASAAELQILPRPDAAAIELPGRAGDQLLLDHDGRHVVYLADGGVVWTADVEKGEARPLDTQRLAGCTLLAGGRDSLAERDDSGWMLAGTESGEVILFNLEGAVFQSEATTWPNQLNPKLLSLACDSEGEVVLAGFANDAIRWFRRQGDRLVVDGGLAGFPGPVQSVSVNGTQFAAAGELFYFICLAPETGEPIDVQRSFTHQTMHLQSQIALCGDGASPRITLWGEYPQVTADRRTVWLYEIDVASGHMHRPMVSAIEKSAQLRSLAASGSLIAAISDGKLLVAQPSGHDTPAPRTFGALVHQLLDENQFDEIERCTRYLGDPQRRFPQYQAEWVSCVSQALLPENGDHRVREKKLLAWLDADPDSVTAWLALAKHYISTAWAARGSGFADTVTDFGWEMVEQQVPKADLIVRSLLASSCEEPALYYLAGGQTGIAGWTHLERKRFGERAVELFPNYFDLHTSVAFYRLPRWGGSHSEVLRYIELVADAAEEDQQDAYYAVLAASLQKLYNPEHDLELTPVDLDRMHRGMLQPSPEAYNGSYALFLMLQTAAVKGEIGFAGFYFDQLISEHPILPAATNRPVFRSLNEWADTAYAMLVKHMDKLEAEKQAAGEPQAAGEAEARPEASDEANN